MRDPNAHKTLSLRLHSCPRPGKTTLTPMILLMLALGGCASSPGQPEPEVPAPVEVELDPPEPVLQPAASPPAPITQVCAWSRTKGLAEVVGLEDADAEFRFYPGDISVAVPSGQTYQRGREFKAILMQAEGCTTRLELVDAVP